jgi:hypothetical protein
MIRVRLPDCETRGSRQLPLMNDGEHLSCRVSWLDVWHRSYFST